MKKFINTFIYKYMKRFINTFVYKACVKVEQVCATSATSAQHGKDSVRRFLSKPEGGKEVCATSAQAGKYITEK